MARLGDAQRMVAKALLKRPPLEHRDDLTAQTLAGMMLQLTGVAVRWCFEHGHTDVSPTLEHMLATLGNLFCATRRA